MSLEKKYTSTRSKLVNFFKNNPQRMKEVSKGVFRPVSVQIAPTDKCNLSCVFCSVKNRDMKELDRETAFQAVLDFVSLGAKTVEITGGGDPTLWPYLEELIVYSKHLGLKVGLITNGIRLKEAVKPEVLKLLSWVRVSLNGLDYGKVIDLPKIPDGVTLGFSYVWNELSSPSVLSVLRDYKIKYNASYVRVVPDCRSVKFIDDYNKNVVCLLNGLDGFFFQSKDYVAPVRCWMGWLKPFVNSDGFVYHCSANPLIDLKFNRKFRICNVKDVVSKWQVPKCFSTKFCGECFFKSQNDLIEDLMVEGVHNEFI